MRPHISVLTLYFCPWNEWWDLCCCHVVVLQSSCSSWVCDRSRVVLVVQSSHSECLGLWEQWSDSRVAVVLQYAHTHIPTCRHSHKHTDTDTDIDTDNTSTSRDTNTDAETETERHGQRKRQRQRHRLDTNIDTDRHWRTHCNRVSQTRLATDTFGSNNRDFWLGLCLCVNLFFDKWQGSCVTQTCTTTIYWMGVPLTFAVRSVSDVS